MAELSDVIKALEAQNKILSDGLSRAAGKGSFRTAHESQSKDASDREDEKEGLKREKTNTDLLKQIAKNTAGMGGGGDGEGEEDGKGKKKKKSRFGFKIPKTMLGKLGMVGIAVAGTVAIADSIGNAISATKDKELAHLETETKAVAGFLGGAKGKKGWGNAMKGAMKGAATGALIGMPFGPVGMVLGGLIGGALGGLGFL